MKYKKKGLLRCIFKVKPGAEANSGHAKPIPSTGTSSGIIPSMPWTVEGVGDGDDGARGKRGLL